MNSSNADSVERRRHPRTHVPPAYTEIRVRRDGHQRFDLRGHVHDISPGGVRFELDNPLPDGEAIAIRVTLPNGTHLGGQKKIEAAAHVLRTCNPGEPGSALVVAVFDA